MELKRRLQEAIRAIGEGWILYQTTEQVLLAQLPKPGLFSQKTDELWEVLKLPGDEHEKCLIEARVFNAKKEVLLLSGGSFTKDFALPQKNSNKDAFHYIERVHLLWGDWVEGGSLVETQSGNPAMKIPTWGMSAQEYPAPVRLKVIQKIGFDAHENPYIADWRCISVEGSRR